MNQKNKTPIYIYSILPNNSKKAIKTEKDIITFFVIFFILLILLFVMEYQMSHHFYESRTTSMLPKRFLYTILAGLICLCKKNVPNRKKSARKNFWCRNQNVISCRFGFIYKPENNLQLFHMKYKGAQAPPVCAENMVFIVNNCKNRNGDVLYFFAVVLYF